MLRNIAWGVAFGMFLVGAMLGITWGASALFNESILETERQVKIAGRALGVLFFGSAGIFHMLAFWNYKRRRQERWEESKG